MTNLLMCYGCEEPTNIMLGEFFAHMEKKGQVAFRRKISQEVIDEDIQWADVIICPRVQDSLTASIVNIAKKNKRFIFSFVDDDFFSLKDHKVRRALEERYLLSSLKNSDVVGGSNTKLAKKLCDMVGCDRIGIIETAISEEELKKPEIKEVEDELRIAYYVNDATTYTFDSIIAPILLELAQRLNKRINITCYSVNPAIPSDNRIIFRHKDRMSLEDFRKDLRMGDYDLGIAPLEDTEFSECKYINKFMEYTRAGIPCIYSNVSPYKEFIESGIIGTLCENDKESWIIAFENNLDSTYRETCIRNAQQLIRNKFSYDSIIESIIDQAPELISYKAPKVRINKMRGARIKNKVSSLSIPFAHAIGRARIEGLGSVVEWGVGHYITKTR